MTQVSKETELFLAVDSKIPLIELNADFSVSVQINVNYPLTIKSSSSESPFQISKNSSLYEAIFQVTGGGSLTLENIILDGQKGLHPSKDAHNGPLIYVSGGTLHLKSKTILQNNFSYAGGGGVCVIGIRSASSSFVMDGNSKIRGCSSRTCGGGLIAYAFHPDDHFSVLDQASIEKNTACHGGGIYVRSFSRLAPGLLTLSGSCTIKENTAAGNGGGINFSSFREDSGKPSSLTFSGNVEITGNKASYGAGIYYFGANDGDQLDFHHCRICKNSALEDGGGLCIFSRSGASVTVAHSMICDNKSGNDGGGIFLGNLKPGSPARLALMTSEVIRNLASSHGGGIAFLTGTEEFALHLTEDKISENTSAADGGAVFIKAEGDGTMNVSQTNFTKNTAGNDGGGLFFLLDRQEALVNLALTSTAFSLNTAQNNGGGLLLASGSGALDTVFYNCSVHENTALSGSGGGLRLLGPSNSLNLRGICRLSQNLACKNGSGISFGNGAFAVLDTGAKLSDSLYLEDERSALRLENALTPAADIQLEPSGYVSPAENGNPLTIAVVFNEKAKLHPFDVNAFRQPSKNFYGWKFDLNEDKTKILLLPAKYKIQYVNLMESTNPNPAHFTVQSPDITLSNPSPLKDCRFDGWYDDPFEGNQITLIPQGSTGNLTLYARWIPLSPAVPQEQKKKSFKNLLSKSKN